MTTKISRLILLPTVIVLSVLLSGCQFADQLKSSIDTTQNKTADDSWKKQGNVYTTQVNYESPGGQESNKFIITLEDDTIKDVQVEVYTEIDASIRYQKQFAQELTKVIVGKKLSQLTKVDKISGASLTTNAFNQALSLLKTQI